MSEIESKKRLKSTRKLSDVERICEINHERRKYVEEHDQYTDFGLVQIETKEADCNSLRPRNDKRVSRKRRSVLRMVCSACDMAAGGGAAFVGLGLASGDLLTVVVGLLVAATFLISGTHLEDTLEAAR